MITGEDVKNFRQRRNLSRKALAETCGLTEGKIWRIEEKGKIHPDEERVLTLAGVTNVTGGGAPVRIETPPPPPPPIALAARVSFTPVEPEPVVVDLAALSRAAQREFRFYFSNSELRTFKRCRRKWYLGWYVGWHLKKESPVGVRQVGERLHMALKTHYSPDGPLDMFAALEGLILLDRAALTEESPETRKQFEDDANLERIMLEGYLEWLAVTGADAELQVIAPETYVEVEFPELADEGVALIGKIDVRVRRVLDGARMFIDHKSVGSLTRPALTLPLDEQMLHYHLLELLELGDTDERAVGALYNMLRRVKRTASAKPPFYERLEVRHNDREIASYRLRLVGEIQDVLEVRDQLDANANHRRVAYPNPTQDCTWDCPFFSVCPMFDDGSRVDDMLTEYYVVRDPLDYYLKEVLNEE